MKVFLNGCIVNEDQAVISVFDHGFLYGFGLFETMRAYSGQPFLFEHHYNRLVEAAQSYQICMNKTVDQLYDDVRLTLRENNLEDAYIRITLSSGDQGLGLWGEMHHEPMWVIMVQPIGQMPSVKGLVSLQLKRSSAAGEFRTKSLSFANNMLAKKELYEREEPNKEGVFVSEDGYIVEGTVSNLFFVREGVLYTPHKQTGLLPGVTRAFIMELAQKMNVEFQEGFFTLEQLYEAEEIFMTNSIQEIVPVDQLDGKKFATIGTVTKLLKDAYCSAIEAQGDVMDDQSGS